MTNTHINVGGHKVSAGIKYSTSEVRTGDVWIDGKPIYRKVISTTTPSYTTAEANTLIDSSLTMAYCTAIKMYGYLVLEDQVTPIPYSYGNSTGSAVLPKQVFGLRQGSSGIILHATLVLNPSAFSNKELVVVIEYTKTTD